MFVKNVKLVQLVFLFGLFLLPLVFWPWAAVPYEIPKVWFFQRWVEVLGIMGFLGGIREMRGRKGSLKLVFGVWLFVLVATVSSIFGADFGKSLIGNYYRSDGLLTLFHLAGLFFFLIVFWEQRWEKPIIKVFAWSSLLLSSWTLLLGAKYWIWGNWGSPLGFTPRGIWGNWGGAVFGKAIGGTFGNPNFLAGYLVVTLPFVFSFFGGRRVTRMIAFLMQAGAIALTQSAGGILGIIIFAAGWYFLLHKGANLRRDRKKLLFFGGLSALAISLFILFFGLNTFRKPRSQFDFFPESRPRIWTKAVLSFVKRPALGWGWANFDYAFSSIDWPLKVEADVYVDKAHSGLLEVLVSMGIVGLGIYLFLAIRSIREIRKRTGEAENKEFFGTILLAFLLFLFHSQTNVISINEEVIFWLILGIAGSGIVKQKER